MATKLLTEYTDEELQEIFQPTKCAKCGITIHESKTGMRKVAGDECYCSACYFESIGELIDDCPIGIPGRHR